MKKFMDAAIVKNYLSRLFYATLFFITVGTCLLLSVIAGLSPFRTLLVCGVLAASALLILITYKVYYYSLQQVNTLETKYASATVADSANELDENLTGESPSHYNDPEYWKSLTFGELLADDAAYKFVKNPDYDFLVGGNTFFVFCKAFVDYYAEVRGVDASGLKIVDMTNQLDAENLTDDFLTYWSNHQKHYISLHAAMTTTRCFGNLANQYLPWINSRPNNDDSDIWSDTIFESENDPVN